ncbi:MAG: anthranilate phosphoribosyltransferase [Bacteroidetes bacterium]|nr:anthranilate phosphoribosyltransferase [Bacteroidota bacterium]
MIQTAIKKVVEGHHLSRNEAYQVMNDIMEGKALPTQIAGYLIALRMKGEVVDEIVGSAGAMRDFATVVKPVTGGLCDTCGTGGDASGTFNISTAAAFAAAAAGVKVAKHGNRAVSSQSGSADVLQALGVTITLSAEQMAQSIDQTGIGFLFAQTLHPAMKNAIGPRRELGVRTIFNMLGPLTNPARARRQVIGVFHPGLTELFAEVLREMGSEHVLVVHGLGGYDEFSVTGPTQVTELKNGEIRTYRVNPVEFGLKEYNHDDLLGGTPEHNARIITSVFTGQETGAPLAVIALNAGAAIYVSGLAGSIFEGVDLALAAISDGRAYKKVQDLAAFTNQFEPRA